MSKRLHDDDLSEMVVFFQNELVSAVSEPCYQDAVRVGVLTSAALHHIERAEELVGGKLEEAFGNGFDHFRHGEFGSSIRTMVEGALNEAVANLRRPII